MNGHVSSGSAVCIRKYAAYVSGTLPIGLSADRVNREPI